MLQGHLAAQKVSSKTTVPFIVKVADELNTVSRFRRDALRYVGRVKSYAVVAAQITEQRQEFAFSTPDLNNFFAVQRIAINQSPREVFMPRLEEPGKTLGFLASGRILNDCAVKRCVIDEATIQTESEPDVTGRKGQRLFTPREKKHTIYGRRRRFVKDLYLLAFTRRAVQSDWI